MNSVRHKAVMGAIFQSIGGISQVIIRLVGSMVLARILSPNDFGLFALVTLVYGFLVQFKTFGATQAVVARKNISQKQLTTVFYINFVLNLILFILFFNLSTLISNIYNEPRVVDAMKVVSFIFLFHSISTIPSVLLERKMDFYYLNIISISGALIEIGFSIVLAYYYNFGYWSLIWGLIIGELYMSIVKILLVRWKPSLQFSIKSFLFFVKFGFFLAGENALIYLRQNLDYFFVGKLFSTTSLGIYSFAYRLPNMIYARLLSPISGTINPSMARMKTEKEIINAFFKFTKYNAYIATPILILLYILAKPIILLLWGDQWIESVPLMQILVIVAGVQILALPIGSVFLRFNNPQALFKISLIKLLISIPIIIISGYFFNLIGIAYGMVITAIFSYVVSFLYLKRVISISFIKLFNILFPLLTVAILTLILTMQIYDILESMGYIMTILVTSFSCFSLYIIFIKLFKNEWNEILDIIKVNILKK